MRRMDLAGFAALGVLASTWAGSARAVVDIRFERWSVSNGIRRDVVAPVDSVTGIGVTFDATVTADDLAHGLRFAIAERDPGGNDVLVRFELQPCAPVPAIGADVVISAGITVYCDVSGELRVRNGVTWQATWCDFPDQRVCGAVNAPAAALPSPSEPESWEFVVLGDSDVEGSFPTPDDVTACGTPSGSTPQYVAPDFAQSGSIGVFADSMGVACSDHIQPFEPFTWYVVAELEGMTRCGLTVVEFGIPPLPPEFFVNVIPNPRAHGAFGSPFGQAILGFDCERGDTERIVLYTVSGITTQPVHDLAMPVTAAMPPSNERWPYPWVAVCPEPGSARRRMRTSTFYINPEPNHDCETPVPALPTSWSAMKSLYGG